MKVIKTEKNIKFHFKTIWEINLFYVIIFISPTKYINMVTNQMHHRSLKIKILILSIKKSTLYINQLQIAIIRVISLVMTEKDIYCVIVPHNFIIKKAICTDLHRWIHFISCGIVQNIEKNNQGIRLPWS